MITLPTDPEALAALEGRRDAYNLRNGTSLSTEEYAQLLLDAEAIAAKNDGINAKGYALLEAAKQLPDAHRLALTAMFEAIIAKVSVTPEADLPTLSASITAAIA